MSKDIEIDMNITTYVRYDLSVTKRHLVSKQKRGNQLDRWYQLYLSKEIFLA